MSQIAEVLPLLRGEMSKMRIPHTRDKVYKDECVYTFDSPYSDSGLYVNTITFNGVGERFLRHDARVSGCKIYLHQKWTQVPHVRSENEKTQDEPTKLAIGVEGGFGNDPKFDVVKEHNLVVVRGSDLVTIPLPCTELPEFISNVLNGIISHGGMKQTMQLASWNADQEKIVSKYADGLPQVNPSGMKISQDPKQWKDAASDATDNLWLNLSTGYIGGGRKNWDGSGGSGSALQHYIDTGRKYPLVVKLGTITAHGADVWSYAEDEDCLVIDPHLADHLSFWGIDIMTLEKTDKSFGEMEVDLNKSYGWSKLMEGSEQLEPLSGAGLVGLRNIGSSCYMNSALQCLLAIPEIQQRYYGNHAAIVESLPASHNQPANEIAVQFSKVADALLSDRYAAPLTTEAVVEGGSTVVASLSEQAIDASTLEKYVVAPTMFKHAIGKDHPEFSSGRQQDVTEYLTYLLDVLKRDERTSLGRFAATSTQHPTASLFEFHVEEKAKLVGGNDVKLAKIGANTLRSMMELPVPLDKAVRKPVVDDDEAEGKASEAKRPRVDDPAHDMEQLLVPLTACLDAWQGTEVVQLDHPTRGQRLPFLKTLRVKTFPRYLIVKLQRYYIGDNWTQKKITAEVPMPLHLDLTSLQAEGLLAGEEELVETATASGTSSASAAAASSAVTPDENLVAQLVAMGFSENGAKRAAIATRNADAEIAMQWVFEHMEDANFNDPPVIEATPSATGASSGDSGNAIDEGSIEMLSAMGFTAEQARAALTATSNNVERAADWLFSRMDDLDAAVAEVLSGAGATASSASSSSPSGSAATGPEGLAAETPAEGKYSLMSVISHVGKSAEHGHYICHVLKDDRWVLFNDEKVGKTERPPLGYGFVYIYRRNDGPGTW